VRDFLSDHLYWGFDVTDLSMTTPGLFMTRWVTHYCAPNFIFWPGLERIGGIPRDEQAAVGLVPSHPRPVARVLELTLVRLGFFLLVRFSPFGRGGDLGAGLVDGLAGRAGFFAAMGRARVRLGIDPWAQCNGLDTT